VIALDTSHEPPFGAPNERSRDWLLTLIRDCQLVAGDAIQLQPLPLLERTRTLVDTVPKTIGASEQTVVVLVLAKTTAGIVRLASLSGDPEIGRSALQLTRSLLSDSWRLDMASHIETCARRARAMGDRHDERATTHDPVRAALLIIDRDYADDGLSLERVAKQVGQSASHLAHLLQERTHATFHEHLRARRMSAAIRLLSDPALRIKDIWERVGCATRRQFERDVREVFGTSARQLRTRYLARSHEPIPG
jgi:AraC-like DNA-binding protein